VSETDEAPEAVAGSAAEKVQEKKPPRELWPIAVHLTVTAVVAAVVFAAVIAMVWWAAGRPALINSSPAKVTAKDKLDLVKIGLTVVAGVGGLVALVVAYRRQRVHEQENERAKATEIREKAKVAEDNRRAVASEGRENTKLFNERFGAASAQLGHERAAVRLAGLYALAGLADDWAEQRQTCIDVLCAYLRMPYDPDPESEKHREGEKEVRHTILRIIRDHLQDPHGPRSWCGHDFDFTGAVFDGGTLDGAKFTGGEVYFTGAKFTGGRVSFHGAEFIGGSVVYFNDAKFTGGTVSFTYAEFSGRVVFFNDAEFSGGTVSFTGAKFTGGTVFFGPAKFTGGTVYFNDAWFTGSEVYFSRAEFTGGRVDLSGVANYSVPPTFNFRGSTPPPGLRLPSSRRTPRTIGRTAARIRDPGEDQEQLPAT
jgi:hypothetical protein